MEILRKLLICTLIIRYYDSLYVKPYEYDIDGYQVLFPQDIGSRERDRLSRRIVEVGMGFHHKYRGIAVAKVEVSSAFYLCPLSSLLPNPSMKCRGSVEITSRMGEIPVPLPFTGMSTAGIGTIQMFAYQILVGKCLLV
jgi:hypothetical protein